MKKVVRWFVALGLILSPFGIKKTQASMFEFLNTQRLTGESQAVRMGQITSQWSSWDPEKRMIFTYSKLKVEQTIKGKHQSEVLVRQPGGQTEKIGMIVHGAATFQKGEKAILFLRNDPDGAPSVVGMAQGKFQIQKDEKTGEEMAIFRTPRNMEFYSLSKHRQPREMSSGEANRRLPLHKFIQEIQRYSTLGSSPTR